MVVFCLFPHFVELSRDMPDTVLAVVCSNTWWGM